MGIAFSEHYLRVQQWDSLSQMKTELSSCQLGAIVLGEEIEGVQLYYSISVFIGSEGHRFGIGLCTDFHGLYPQLLALPESEALLIGFDRQVVSVDISLKQINAKIDLPVLFHRFVLLAKTGLILVFDEIGIVALDLRCNEKWRYERDVITSYQITDNILSLDFMDSHSIRIDVRSGACLQSF